ncbi:MAG TPA: hypothetical protein VK028_00765, partial [Micromonosporaceae bacterium]|nr:hypothetical protein [Micromonosporaceae bacterium]
PTETPEPTETPSEPSASPPPGEAIVVVGGLIRARLTTDMAGTVTPRSSEIQPVLVPEDRAFWQWDIKPTSSGEYTVTVHLTVLEADTDVPLIADQVLAIPLQVNQTPRKVASQAWFGIKEIATVLGALGVSVVAVVGFLVRWFIKRRRVRPGAGGGPASPA